MEVEGHETQNSKCRNPEKSKLENSLRRREIRTRSRSQRRTNLPRRDQRLKRWKGAGLALRRARRRGHGNPVEKMTRRARRERNGAGARGHRSQFWAGFRLPRRRTKPKRLWRPCRAPKARRWAGNSGSGCGAPIAPRSSCRTRYAITTPAPNGIASTSINKIGVRSHVFNTLIYGSSANGQPGIGDGPVFAAD
jgi:hypothetical protein